MHPRCTLHTKRRFDYTLLQSRTPQGVALVCRLGCQCDMVVLSRGYLASLGLFRADQHLYTGTSAHKTDGHAKVRTSQLLGIAAGTTPVTNRGVSGLLWGRWSRVHRLTVLNNSRRAILACFVGDCARLSGLQCSTKAARSSGLLLVEIEPRFTRAVEQQQQGDSGLMWG